MKKLYSISIALLILLAGMHLSFAKHYCGGKLAASKISISGELASCGMEGSEDTCTFPGAHLKSHCCDDEVSVYTVDNYSPTFSNLTDFTQRDLQLFTLPVKQAYSTFISNRLFLASVGPPDNLFTRSVSLSDICVFRN